MGNKKREIQKLISLIRTTRKELHFLIKETSDINKPEIIKISQNLDNLLNEYNEIIQSLHKEDSES